ncbi:VOC family protein [Halobacillus sp. A5]|uniref:VOC family protein n=1 Tax=Halobacillus sp. A5 TaxID=2880263 RepID=UPI0020A61E34|nr:VOC family protein [Halobacillus sp. A5]MCP3028439.1 VOC family protein [Halobacillus sp. A5]
MERVTPFLMFQGNAEEAMHFYITIIEGSEVIAIQRYGPNEVGEEGSVKQAVFSLKGQEFMCIDSDVQHEFTFTPSFSIYLTCENEKEIDHVYQSFSEGGNELMPLGDYSFSRKFGWVVDQFGVSWQLNLP